MSSTAGLLALRDQLSDVAFPYAIDGADRARLERRELLDQLDDYLLPRIAKLDAPLLVVLGGSTGAGKSTITNSLVGHEVSEPGVLRPTTRTPVLVCNPEDREWFVSGGVLPELPRSSGQRPTGAGLHLVTTESLHPGLAILDSPDIDSIETANHDLASQLLGAADLWLFVTTAARYADAVPWEYLSRAKERSIALALIINRIPPGAEESVSGHLKEMLTDKHLTTVEVFPIVETELAAGQLTEELQPVRDWLSGLAADAEKRREVIVHSVEGALASIPRRVQGLATALDAQAHVATGLAAVVDQTYREAGEQIQNQLTSGQVLRGEVLNNWKDIVGTGELMAGLQRGVGKVRDTVTSLFTGKRRDDTAMRGELKHNVAIVVRDAADHGAASTVEAWEAMPGGAQALADAPAGIARASTTLTGSLNNEIEQWQQGVFELVRELAGPKVNLARTLTFGINSLGLAAMVAVFSSTGGLTGGEAAVAGGTAAVSQAILSAIFGEQAIRDIVALASDDLAKRIEALLDGERQRFLSLLPSDEEAAAAARLRELGSGIKPKEILGL